MKKPLYGIVKNRFFKCTFIVNAEIEVMEEESDVLCKYEEVTVEGFLDVSMIMSCWNRYDEASRTEKQNQSVVIMSTGDSYVIVASQKDIYDAIQRYEQPYIRAT